MAQRNGWREVGSERRIAAGIRGDVEEREKCFAFAKTRLAGSYTVKKLDAESLIGRAVERASDDGPRVFAIGRGPGEDREILHKVRPGGRTAWMIGSRPVVRRISRGGNQVDTSFGGGTGGAVAENRIAKNRVARIWSAVAGDGQAEDGHAGLAVMSDNVSGSWARSPDGIRLDRQLARSSETAEDDSLSQVAD